MASSTIIKDNVIKTLFSGATDVMSDTTVTLTEPSSGYSVYLARFNTSANDPSSGRMNVIIGQTGGYYALSDSNHTGAVRISLADTTFRVVAQTGFTSLYLTALNGIR